MPATKFASLKPAQAGNKGTYGLDNTDAAP